MSEDRVKQGKNLFKAFENANVDNDNDIVNNKDKNNNNNKNNDINKDKIVNNNKDNNKNNNINKFNDLLEEDNKDKLVSKGIYFRQDQIQFIKKYAKLTKKNQSQLVREILDIAISEIEKG